MTHRYETDRTKKEKRRLEREKLKAMDVRQRVSYLWTYYKIWLAVAAALAGCIYIGGKMYQGMQEHVIVSVAMIGNGQGNGSGGAQELADGFKAYVGADGTHDTVRVNQNVTADEGGLTSQTLLTTLIGAGAVDVPMSLS